MNPRLSRTRLEGVESDARKAKREIVGRLAALRAARRAFDGRPAFVQWQVLSWLPHADDFRTLVRRAGIDPRPHADVIREAEEATEYLSAALDGSAWDAAAVELDRVIAALARIGAGLGPTSSLLTRRIGRRTAVDFLANLAFDRKRRGTVLNAWRRLDLALAALAYARRSSNLEKRRERLLRALNADVDLTNLRIAYRVGPVHRDTRREIVRLFDEAGEAAEYASAELDQRAWNAAETDLDRLDACLRALRHILQRESPIYLPEPWPLRLPMRLATTQAMRHEASQAPVPGVG